MQLKKILAVCVAAMFFGCHGRLRWRRQQLVKLGQQ